MTLEQWTLVGQLRDKFRQEAEQHEINLGWGLLGAGEKLDAARATISALTALLAASPAPAPFDSDHADALRRLDAMLAKTIDEVNARRGMAHADRTATDAAESAGAALVARTTGRTALPRSPAERQQSADRHDRIADTAERDGNALAVALAALRYPSAAPATAGDGTSLVTLKRKHSCQSCDMTDTEYGFVDGWNAAIDAARALTAAPAPEPPEGGGLVCAGYVSSMARRLTRGA